MAKFSIIVSMALLHSFLCISLGPLQLMFAILDMTWIKEMKQECVKVMDPVQLEYGVDYLHLAWVSWLCTIFGI